MYQGKLGVINTLPPASKFGGAEISMGLQVRALESMGFKISLGVVSTHLARDHVQAESFHIFPNRNIYELFSKPKGRLHRFLWHIVDFMSLNYFDVRKWLRDEKVELIIVHNEYGLGFSVPLAARSLRIPIIKVVHDYSISCERATYFRKNAPCKDICLSCKPKQLAANFVGYNAFIVVSNWMRNWLLNVVLFKRISNMSSSSTVVLYPRFEDHVVFESHERRKYPLAYLGRVSSEKGIDFILEECRKLNLNIVVAGSGDSLEVENLKKRFDKVLFLGSVDPINFLRQVEILVVPSKWNEPFGRVVVEASLNGCKVLLSRQPGLLEAATASESVHSVFEFGDSNSFLEAWSDLNGKSVEKVSPLPEILSNQDEILRNLLGRFFTL
jgi:glycosyltransferase involved in cell wall biosynthesis